MMLTYLTLILAASAAYVYAEPQFLPGYYPNQEMFRASQPQPSIDVDQKSEGRFLFTTLTVTLSTSTLTSTGTSIVTCTTSTAGLSVCTPSGRRRRGVFLNNKEGRGLFYDEQENQGDDIGSIFLPSEPKSVEEKPQEAAVEPSREIRQSPTVPLMVQPGFRFNPPNPNARFLLAFGTTTVTTTTFTISTTSLTAICQSTTGFQLCGSSGK